MPRHAFFALLAVLAVAGCRHAQQVGQPAPSAGEPSKREARIPARPGRPAIAADPAGLMRPGSAKRIEDALQSRGYLRESSASARGNQITREAAVALRRFQHDQGLAETGVPDRETLRRLGVDPNEVYRTAGHSDHAPSEGTGSE